MQRISSTHVAACLFWGNRKSCRGSTLSSCYVPPKSTFPYVPLQSSSCSTDKDVGSYNQQFRLTDKDQRRPKGNTAVASAIAKTEHSNIMQRTVLCMCSMPVSVTSFLASSISVCRSQPNSVLTSVQHFSNQSFCLYIPENMTTLSCSYCLGQEFFTLLWNDNWRIWRKAALNLPVVIGCCISQSRSCFITNVYRWQSKTFLYLLSLTDLWSGSRPYSPDAPRP